MSMPSGMQHRNYHINKCYVLILTNLILSQMSTAREKNDMLAMIILFRYLINLNPNGFVYEKIKVRLDSYEDVKNR